jgi:molybdopterin molybdotransferase
MGRRPSRTEFAPARIVPTDRGPGVEILGRGGSARLRPLIEADGLAEIYALHAPVESGATVLFHPFRTASRFKTTKRSDMRCAW